MIRVVGCQIVIRVSSSRNNGAPGPAVDNGAGGVGRTVPSIGAGREKRYRRSGSVQHASGGEGQLLTPAAQTRGVPTQGHRRLAAPDSAGRLRDRIPSAIMEKIGGDTRTGC